MAFPFGLALIATNKNVTRLSHDAAFLYRCTNLHPGPRESSIWTGHITQFPWWQPWDAVVFHRPRDTWRLRFLTRWLARRGTKLIADFDDLVIDPALARYSPGVLNGLVSLDATQAQFRSHQRAAARFDVITVSTPPLAVHAQAIPGSAAKVVVVPNALHWSWLSMPAHPEPGPEPVLSYLPGTRSHDRDFATVAAGLGQVLQRHPEARLSVTGPLNFNVPGVAQGAGRVVHQPKVPFERYHELFRGVHVNLAPLEATPFTECKSAIKVMEAAWWGIPTVCSALPDAERFVGAGAHIAHSPAEFADAVHNLLANPDHLHHLRYTLRDKVLPLANIHTVAQSWLAHVF